MVVTLFCYKPSCFSYVNDHVHGLVSMRIPRFALQKQEGLWQNKVTASLAFAQRLGHWAHNCKIACSSAKRDNSVRSILLRQLASRAKQQLCMYNIFGIFLWHPLQTYNVKYVNVMFIWGCILTTGIFESSSVDLLGTESQTRETMWVSCCLPHNKRSRTQPLSVWH